MTRSHVMLCSCLISHRAQMVGNSLSPFLNRQPGGLATSQLHSMATMQPANSNWKHDDWPPLLEKVNNCLPPFVLCSFVVEAEGPGAELHHHVTLGGKKDLGTSRWRSAGAIETLMPSSSTSSTLPRVKLLRLVPNRATTNPRRERGRGWDIPPCSGVLAPPAVAFAHQPGCSHQDSNLDP